MPIVQVSFFFRAIVRTYSVVTDSVCPTSTYDNALVYCTSSSVDVHSVSLLAILRSSMFAVRQCAACQSQKNGEETENEKQ